MSTNKKIVDSIIIPTLIGLFSFLLVYGLTPLCVTNDNWIMAGYDEPDIIQHYAGWISYRNSDWSYPIGLAKDMACEDGTYISYTDSIPWVAITFKLFRNLLPYTFQFFGLYTLLCYILQAISSFKIIYFKTQNTVFSTLSTSLFTFSPILMERALRHTALGSQWLILFSILIYLHNKAKYSFSHYIELSILMILAIGIHPYFLPMIGVFFLLCVVDDIFRKNYFCVLFLMFSLIFTYGVGCIIGVLGTKVNASRKGYGFYSMNLNAIINPTSCGAYSWSNILKTRPQILGNYDGFNYLGFGIIFALLLSFVLIILSNNISKLIQACQKNVFLILALILCFLFAISNVITLDDNILVEIELPETIQYLCGIFRASSRLFYPVYYCIFILCILVIWQICSKFSTSKAIIVLGFVLLLQILDLSSPIHEKHVNMSQNSSFISLLDDPNLTNILTSSSDVILEQYDADIRSLAVAASKSKCKLYYSVANSGDYFATYQVADEITEQIKSDGIINGHLIATTDCNVVREYIQYGNIDYYYFEGQYFIKQK